MDRTQRRAALAAAVLVLLAHCGRAVRLDQRDEETSETVNSGRMKPYAGLGLALAGATTAFMHPSQIGNSASTRFGPPRSQFVGPQEIEQPLQINRALDPWKIYGLRNPGWGSGGLDKAKRERYDSGYRRFGPLAAKTLHQAHPYNFAEEVDPDYIHLRVFRFDNSDAHVQRRVQLGPNDNFGDLAWVSVRLAARFRGPTLLDIDYGKVLSVYTVRVRLQNTYGFYTSCMRRKCGLGGVRGATSSEFGYDMLREYGLCEGGDPGLEASGMGCRWYSLMTPSDHSQPREDEFTDFQYEGSMDLTKVFPAGLDGQAPTSPYANASATQFLDITAQIVRQNLARAAENGF